MLQGRFVAEVGLRQAWPFVAFCDSHPSATSEIRLYIDTTFRLEPGRRVFEDGDAERAAAELLDLSNRTLTDVQTKEANELLLSFDGGDPGARHCGNRGDLHHPRWLVAGRAVDERCFARRRWCRSEFEGQRLVGWA
jgi:hypothetical protein